LLALALALALVLALVVVLVGRALHGRRPSTG
jgi:hypothetical protein